MPNQTRGLPNDRVIIIGENFNATRKIKATSPRVREVDGATGIAYTDLDGTARLLDCTDVIPDDPAERHSFMVPHIAQALRNKDLEYITYAIRAQERAGAHIIDLCVDEMSVYPEERYEWIKYLVETAQSITDSIVAIDSSDSKTIYAGLEAHDSSKSRPAINSFNLENGRQELVGMAKERDAILFANASGNTGMPQNAEERVANLSRCMDMMDEGGIAPEDRFPSTRWSSPWARVPSSAGTTSTRCARCARSTRTCTSSAGTATSRSGCPTASSSTRRSSPCRSRPAATPRCSTR